MAQVPETEVTEKLNAILKILQDFGLNVINHLGQVKKAVSVLTDKVDSLAEATIQVKGLGTRLGEVIRSNDKITEDLNYLKKMARNQAGTQNNHDNGGTPAPRTPLPSSDTQAAFEHAEKILHGSEDRDEYQQTLQQLQEDLYEINGPSPILPEIRKTINRCKQADAITGAVKSEILAKLEAWKGRL